MGVENMKNLSEDYKVPEEYKGKSISDSLNILNEKFKDINREKERQLLKEVIITLNNFVTGKKIRQHRYLK